MKIGIISDIHGGLDELKSALNHLNQEQVDTVVCAGDLVDFGNFDDEVVQLVLAEKIPCVQGNHDRMARKNQQLRKRKSDKDSVTKILQSVTLDLLDQLPQQLRFQWLDVDILLTHAAPWGGDMYIYPESTLPLFQRVVREAKADVIILGHTHRPMWIELEDAIIINSGSISQNYYMEVGTYGILSLPEREFQLFDVKTGEQLDLQKQSR